MLFQALIHLFLAFLPLHSVSDVLQELVSALETFHQNYPQEKIYVFHDKPYYVLGEDIWFSVFACHAVNHRSITPSGLVYVELLSPKGDLLEVRNIQIQDGHGKGDFRLDPNWRQEGTYSLRAYSHYQRNFDESFLFKKSIAIYDSYQKVVANQQKANKAKDEKVQVLFFPEGGDLVTGLSSRIAVKAVDGDRNGTAVKGKIWDQDHNLVTLFVTNERGFGVFSLKPELGKRYRAEILDAGLPPLLLPAAKTSGHLLKIVNSKPDTLLIYAQSSLPTGLEGVFLIAHMRGRPIASKAFESAENQVLVLPKSELPTGILHVTLFSSGGLPVAERLTFIHNADESVHASLSLDKDRCDKRDQVNLQIFLQDLLGKQMSGKVSVAVFDQLSSTRPENQSDIRSYFWLESDVKGRIEDPAYYFEKDDKKRRKDLELLLMTQG